MSEKDLHIVGIWLHWCWFMHNTHLSRLPPVDTNVTLKRIGIRLVIYSQDTGATTNCIVTLRMHRLIKTIKTISRRCVFHYVNGHVQIVHARLRLETQFVHYPVCLAIRTFEWYLDDCDKKKVSRFIGQTCYWPYRYQTSAFRKWQQRQAPRSR